MRQGVYAGGAIKSACLGNEVLALELHRRIILMELIKVMPMGSGGFAGQQAGLSPIAHTGANGTGSGTGVVLAAEPLRYRGVATYYGPGVAPQAGYVDDVALFRLFKRQFRCPLHSRTGVDRSPSYARRAQLN